MNPPNLDIEPPWPPEPPEKCYNCGAPPEQLRYDIVDGWCCLSCGGCDSDE